MRADEDAPSPAGFPQHRSGSTLSSWPMRDAPTPMLGHPPVQVLLIAPPLVCWGLQRLVQTAGPELVLTGSFASIDEALPTLERLSPDVVVLDLDDGYALGDLTQVYQRTRAKILAVTGFSDPDFSRRVLEAGARGLLHKREAPAALLKAIEAVGAGEVFASAQTTRQLFTSAVRHAARAAESEVGKIATLTMRERQTIAAVTADASAPVKVVASRLCISEHTLRNHLTAIYSKLGVSGRLGLHAYASQHELNGRP